MASKPEIANEMTVLDDSFPSTRHLTEEQRENRCVSASDALSEFDKEVIVKAHKALAIEDGKVDPLRAEISADCLSVQNRELVSVPVKATPSASWTIFAVDRHRTHTRLDGSGSLTMRGGPYDVQQRYKNNPSEVQIQAHAWEIQMA